MSFKAFLSEFFGSFSGFLGTLGKFKQNYLGEINDDGTDLRNEYGNAPSGDILKAALIDIWIPILGLPLIYFNSMYGFFLDLFLVVMYSTLMTASFGGTIGQQFFDLVVVDDEGNFIPIEIALKRSCLALVGYLMFCWGFLYCWFKGKGRTLHDEMSGTMILSKRVGPDPSRIKPKETTSAAGYQQFKNKTLDDIDFEYDELEMLGQPVYEIFQRYGNHSKKKVSKSKKNLRRAVPASVLAFEKRVAIIVAITCYLLSMRMALPARWFDVLEGEGDLMTKLTSLFSEESAPSPMNTVPISRPKPKKKLVTQSNPEEKVAAETKSKKGKRQSFAAKDYFYDADKFRRGMKLIREREFDLLNEFMVKKFPLSTPGACKARKEYVKVLYRFGKHHICRYHLKKIITEQVCLVHQKEAKYLWEHKYRFNQIPQ